NNIDDIDNSSGGYTPRPQLQDRCSSYTQGRQLRARIIIENNFW
ncbi:10016_t:CDS:1, partial [Dentiscutata erythropus]